MRERERERERETLACLSAWLAACLPSRLVPYLSFPLFSTARVVLLSSLFFRLRRLYTLSRRIGAAAVAFFAAAPAVIVLGTEISLTCVPLYFFHTRPREHTYIDIHTHSESESSESACARKLSCGAVAAQNRDVWIAAGGPIDFSRIREYTFFSRPALFFAFTASHTHLSLVDRPLLRVPFFILRVHMDAGGGAPSARAFGGESVSQAVYLFALDRLLVSRYRTPFVLAVRYVCVPRRGMGAGISPTSGSKANRPMENCRCG